MPSSSAPRQGFYPSLPSSAASTSVLRGLPPYRWQEQIPNITLSEYGRILDDNEDYNDLMTILFQQSDFHSKTITMWHLWITAQWLRREVDRQQIEVRWLFMEMEGLELQQVLQPHWQMPPRESFSPEAQPPTQYYPAPGQETRYQESVKRSPIPPPTSPPLGAQGNLIIIKDSDEEEERWDDNFYTAESTFSTPISFLYIVKNVKTDDTNTLNALNTYVIIVTNEHQCTRCLIVQNIEASDFNHSGGYCYKLFFLLNIHSPCFHLLFFISSWHVFTSLLYSVSHVFALRLTHFFYLFKLVVRPLYSLAFLRILTFLTWNCSTLDNTQQ